MKNLIKNLKLYNNKHLDIIDKTIKVENNKIIFTDLEQTMIINSKLDIEVGIYNKFLIKESLNMEDYPIVCEYKKEKEVLKISTEKFLSMYKEMVKYTGTDEMRPVMTGIYFDSVNNCLCGTDAHALKTLKIEGLKESFTLPKLNITDLEKILKHFGVKELCFYIDDKNVIITNNKNFDFIIRVIEANYPNYQAVIPQIQEKQIIINADRKEIVDALKIYKELKSPARNLYFDTEKMVCFTKNVDNNFYKEIGSIEYKEIETKIDYRETTLIMPILTGDIKADLGVNLEILLKTNFDKILFTESSRALTIVEKTGNIKTVVKKVSNNTNDKLPNVTELLQTIKDLKAEIVELKKGMVNVDTEKTIIEPTEIQEEAETTETAETRKANLEIIDYSEKSIAIIGNTKEYKEYFKKLGGRFNKYLRCGAGWIFSIKRKDELMSFVGTL